MKKALKKIIIFILALFLSMGLIIAGYVSYVFLSYKRIPDNQTLIVEQAAEQTSNSVLKTGTSYKALTYNIGFGAYLPTYSFFMDGGISSWGDSKESVINTVEKAGALSLSLKPDFALLQEIDLDGTRSYHVDQYEILKKIFTNYSSTFAVNYDSPFLLYPLSQPHGKNKAGLATFSQFPISSSIRRSLPISNSWTRVMDLDRCYSVSRLKVENGKELVIFNIHLSAYGNSDEIRQGQIGMLAADMKKEYEMGNYVLCGGDFNHDLKADENDKSLRQSWAYPFPRASLPEHFSFCLDKLSKEEREKLWNSARNADIPFTEGKSYTVTLDGFIISDNIKCLSYTNQNTGYSFSDHEPVVMTFELN